MASQLAELRVEIDRLGENRYRSRTIETANNQEIVVNAFEYDPSLLLHIEALEYIEEDGSRPDYKVKPIYLAEYGKRLFGWLFGDGTKIRDFLGFRPDYRDGWRVTIDLHPDASLLWGLPWELLHDGREHWGLRNVQIQRTPRGLARLDVGEAPLPLRILVAVSSPIDQAELNTEQEIAIIQSALDDAVRDGKVVLEFLEDVALDELRAALTEGRAHILHYTGHGGRDPTTGETFLALEGDEGKTKPATGRELRRNLRPGLRLVVLSGCMTAQTAHRDAFRGVATALLEDPGGLPAVLAFQASVLDDSAVEFARAFYGSVARGEAVEEALAYSRLALVNRRGEAHADWLLPTLYQRSRDLRLINTASKPEAVEIVQRLDIGGLPLPRSFVGRKLERREIRAALRDWQVNAMYLWGVGGMGKSALAAKMLERPGVELDDALVIRCNEGLPAEIPGKVAALLQGQGVKGHADAASLLLDSRLELGERVRKAAALVADRRYLLVFDNFDDLVEETAGTETRKVKDEVRAFFQALVTVPWKTTSLFTARFRCDLFDNVPPGNWIDIHLEGLNQQQAVMLMNSLPRLRQTPYKGKMDVWEKIGGHPKTIELLEGYLVHYSLREVLENKEIQAQLSEEWERYFMGRLLLRLRLPEQEALAAACVFRGVLDRGMMAHAGADEKMAAHWHDLSLVQREADAPHGTARYSIHQVVREYVMGRLLEEKQRRLHLHAASYYQQLILAPVPNELTPELLKDERKGATQILRALVHQTKNMDVARYATELGLAWQAHLFAAEQYKDAGVIVQAIFEVLELWGQRDLGKGLLRESIATLEGPYKAAAQGNLATMLQYEGNLDEALAIHEEVYRSFEALGNKSNMAVSLGQISYIYRDKGDYDQAIEKAEASLDIGREIGDEEGQARSLHQLSILHHQKGDNATAFSRSQESEALNRRLGRERGIAANLHQEGLILNAMGRPQEAFARFHESLEIETRIGNQKGMADSLAEIGKLLSDNSHTKEAIEAFNKCLDIYRRLNDPAKIGGVLQVLGVVHEHQGQYGAALEKYEEALGLFKQYGPPHYMKVTEQGIERVKQKVREQK